MRSVSTQLRHRYTILLGRARASPTLAWSTGPRASTDRLTDRPCPSHSHDTDTLHVPTLPRGAAMPRSYQNSAVHSRDIYKTENADDVKAKSRDTHTMNCEAGTRERPANLSPCILGFHVRQFFSSVTSHKPFFFPTLVQHVPRIYNTAFWTRLCAHVMHTGVHRPHLLT